MPLKPNALVTLLPAALIVAASAGCARAKTADVASPIEKGRAIYGRLCATCHGAAGNGYAADNAPSLRSPTFLATATDPFRMKYGARSCGKAMLSQ